MRAVVEAVRRQQPARIVVGAPVGALDTCAEFRRLVDDVVCVATPEPFLAVGRWFGDFSETTDADVRRILAEARARGGDRTGPAAPR
jgi:predicted phosphoribosyltransferase